jgi:hypothetical protein
MVNSSTERDQHANEQVLFADDAEFSCRKNMNSGRFGIPFGRRTGKKLWRAKSVALSKKRWGKRPAGAEVEAQGDALEAMRKLDHLLLCFSISQG